MNFWKPIALCSIAGLVATVGTELAHAGGVCHDQPNMSAALASLRAANGSLEKAEHNKDGWRKRAIDATKIAIKETETGCKDAADDKK